MTDAVMDDFVVTTPGAPAPSPEASAPASESALAPAASDSVTSLDEPSAGDPSSAEGRERNDDGTFRPKKGSLQDRINRATWEREEAKREAERERSRAASLEAEIARFREQAPPPEPARTAPATFDGSPKPTLDQFDTYEGWIEAVADWRAEQKIQHLRAEAQMRDAQARELSARQSYHERESTFAQQTPDYVEAMTRAKDLPLSASMQAAVLSSAHGPALAYFLATHPEDAVQLAQETASLPASAAPVVRRLLESRIPAGGAQSGPPSQGSRPSVPPPIKPVGSAPVVADPPIESLPVDDYVEAMNARERAARRR